MVCLKVLTYYIKKYALQTFEKSISYIMQVLISFFAEHIV